MSQTWVRDHRGAAVDLEQVRSGVRADLGGWDDEALACNARGVVHPAQQGRVDEIRRARRAGVLFIMGVLTLLVGGLLLGGAAYSPQDRALLLAWAGPGIAGMLALTWAWYRRVGRTGRVTSVRSRVEATTAQRSEPQVQPRVGPVRVPLDPRWIEQPVVVFLLGGFGGPQYLSGDLDVDRVTRVDPPVADADPLVGDGRSPVVHGRSPVVDGRSPVVDDRSPVAAAVPAPRLASAWAAQAVPAGPGGSGVDVSGVAGSGAGPTGDVVAGDDRVAEYTLKLLLAATALAAAIPLARPWPDSDLVSAVLYLWIFLSIGACLGCPLLLVAAVRESRNRYLLVDDPAIGPLLVRAQRDRPERSCPLASIAAIDQKYVETKHKDTSSTLHLVSGGRLVISGLAGEEVVRLVRRRRPEIPVNRYADAYDGSGGP